MKLARGKLAGRRWQPVAGEVLAVGLPAVVVLIAGHNSGYPMAGALFGCAALVFRRRWPRTTLLLCLPGIVGGLAWPPTIVAMFAVGRARPYLRCLAVWIVVVSVAALAPVFLTQSLRISDYVLTLVFVLFIVTIPMALGALVTTRQQLAESLARLRQATEAESFAKAETARAEERARIAREIHDAVGHHVTLVVVEAGALATTSKDPSAVEKATRIRTLAREALGEMRMTLGLATEQSPRATSLRTIPDLVARAKDAGVRVRLLNELGERAELGPGVGRAAYRVVQEALTNVSKHAPGAAVTVRLQERDDSLHVTVDNDASCERVADIGRGGSGLEGLSERVQMVGGRLETGPSETGGFRLLAVLPHEQHAPCPE